MSDSEPGTLAGGVQVVTDAQIQTAVQGWIADNTVPAATVNTFILYSCRQTPLPCLAQNNRAKITVAITATLTLSITLSFPFAGCPGCVFPGQILDTLTEVNSHEFAEAVTDPALNAWWEDGQGDEIGDLRNRQTTRIGGYVVQTEWSNAQNACAFAFGACGLVQRTRSLLAVAARN